jgi:hypothetical protein
MVTRTATPEYFVSAIVGGGEIFVYDQAGRFQRSVGRPGSGPGELGPLNRVVTGLGDTLVVLDQAQRRIQIFSPSGDFVRGFRTSGSGPLSPLQSGDLLIPRRPATRADHIFEIVDPEGHVVTPLGQSQWSSDNLDLTQWVTSASKSGGFWAASVWEYALHHWSSDGTRERTLVRDASWFPDEPEFLDGAYLTSPPPTLLTHIWEDSAGRLWVFVQKPDADWDPEIGARPNPDWYRRTWDTVVEVIDPTNAEVIVRDSLPYALGATCDSGLMYGVTYSDAGDTELTVFAPTVVEAREDAADGTM